jgi:Txe/YoeB family toxin of Txe-Axe toxin-antitoxin module
MVGEDINTALGVEYFGEEAPSAVPWATLEKYYMLRKNEGMSCVDRDCEITDNNTGKIIERFNLENGRILDSGSLPDQLKRLDILISFLYPTHELNYETRSQQIRLAFEKFSQNRTKIYSKTSVMFTDTVKEKANQLLNQYSNANYKEKPTMEELKSTLNGEYMLYFVAGHGAPNVTSPSEPDFSVFFGSEDLNSLNTPIFLASGCHTQSWWTNDSQNNGKLDSSINRDWFGSKIFSNPYLKVEILGIANQLDKDLRSFVEIALPDLMAEKTLAESLVGKTLKIDNGIIYGDPAFHYNF